MKHHPIRARIIVIIGLLAMLTPSFAKEALMSRNGKPDAGEFYFGRTLIDISAADSQVPRVDRDTVADYAKLGLADELYIGRTDASGRLIYLETWLREPVDEVDLGMIVEGKPLAQHDVPISGDRIDSQKPLFFMREGGEWRSVPAEATLGETEFMRLRLLAPLRGGPPELDAEIFQQRLESIHDYLYRADGQLDRITQRLRQKNFAEDTVFQQKN